MNDLHFSTLLVVTRGMVWYGMVWYGMVWYLGYIIHSLLKGYLNSEGGGGGGGWINTKRQFRHGPNDMNNWHLRDTSCLLDANFFLSWESATFKVWSPIVTK
jgi:hypothetical protein